MGKLTMALTYLTTIACGVLFIYLTVVTSGQWTLVFGAVFFIVYSAYLLWADFFRRRRV